MKYKITPVTAPRMTRRDKWLKPARPCVAQYRAFRDEVKTLGIDVTPYSKIIFNIPMPPSWTKKKKLQLEGQPHTQTPDIDNLVKALLDAIFGDDSHIWKISAEKRWAKEGSIEVVEVV